jgi:hypothetical protein
LAPPVNRRAVIAASTTALFLDSGIASPIEIMTIGAARAAGEPRRPQADRPRIHAAGNTYVTNTDQCYEYGFREGPFTVFGRRSQLPRSRRKLIRRTLLDIHFCLPPTRTTNQE